MQKTEVIVPWDKGLHTRPASVLVNLARSYRSSILIKAHEKVADAKSILSVLLLCATMGTLLEMEIVGEDELLATSAIEQLFSEGNLLEEVTLEAWRMNLDKYLSQSNSKQA
ncbi:MAG: HPr family phosphocarrier protein [Pontiellaceae bacterium]|nr:HPr family phosphocarrier protein [Pontiellaceae bacterium]